MPKTSFSPKQHGFKFRNDFVNEIFLGPFQLETGGRCGGMVYAALDYFYTKTPIPDDTILPIEGSVLSTYIYDRQMTSISNTFDKWVEWCFNPFGWRTSEFFNWGLQDSGGGRLEQLRTEIDHGRPAILGLSNPSDCLKGHQVLAIGYEGSGNNLEIIVYDPNYPNIEKLLRPHPNEFRYYYEDFYFNSDTKWLSYLVDLNYKFQRPPVKQEMAGCSGVDFSNQDLSGRNLSNSNYRCSNCVKTNFTGCTIMSTDFESSDLERANFKGANLRNSNFSKANLNLANFYGADLKNTRFLNAFVADGVFTGADIKLADFSNANLERCDFYGADLHRAVLSKARCINVNFQGASLNTTQLEGANLRNAILVGTDLRNANLRGVDFTGAKLAGADMTGADTTGAIF